MLKLRIYQNSVALLFKFNHHLIQKLQFSRGFQQLSITQMIGKNFDYYSDTGGTTVHIIQLEQNKTQGYAHYFTKHPSKHHKGSKFYIGI